MNDDIKKVLQGFGVETHNLSLYQTAFTHRSYLNESKEKLESNERLEFLGDSVLSFIISTFIYHNRSSDAEGQLTHLRAYIVKTESLAKAADLIGLGKLLRLSRGEELSRGRENNQLLANTYEAILGAIYLDLGIEAATNFVSKSLLPMFETELQSGAPRDAKSQLQEVSQSKYQISPRYKILETSGPDHAKKFKVGVFINNEPVGEGFGNNKQQAEEEAAKQALAQLS